MKKQNTFAEHLYEITFLFMVAFFISSPVFGNADVTQLDRIETKVEAVITVQKEMLDVIDENPLLGKKYGIEINPFRLIFIDKDEKSFSGSFSFFNVRPHVEISIPVFVGKIQDNAEDFSVFTMDGHYRYFLGKQTKGFYISGFSRFATLYGTFEKNNYYAPTKTGRTYKLGGGFGIGYRVFSKRGLYWGASLSLGRYFLGESNKYRSSYSGIIADIDDSEVIFDVEFLKIGYSF